MESILGIDIGGSGIKGAPVNVNTGKLLTERKRIDTPQPSTPKAIIAVILQLVEHFDWQGKPIGCTVPGIVKQGIVFFAPNIDKSWFGTNFQKLLEAETNSIVVALNDADAAGIAEMTYGAGKGHLGTVLMLTFGTGIGSALFIKGHLVPNTELGHLNLSGHEDVERWAAARVKEEKDLSWKKWGKRVNTYLNHINRLLAPDLIIIGGGVSKKHEEFFEFLEVDTEVAPARLLNEAGIIGAALTTYKKIT